MTMLPVDPNLTLTPVTCHRCGAVNRLTLDRGRFHCRNGCRPPEQTGRRRR